MNLLFPLYRTTVINESRNKTVKKTILNTVYKQIVTSLVCVSVIFCVPHKTSAQTVDDFLNYKKNLGSEVMPFLTLPIGAREACLGHAAVALTENGTSAFWNPAALGLLRKHMFSFSHSEMFLGVRNEYLGIAFPRDYLGTFAFHCQMFSGGSFKNSRDIRERPSNPELIDFAAGASYGGAIIPEKLYGGLNFNFLQSKMENEPAKGASGDAFIYSIIGKLSFGLGIKNIGPNIQYTNSKEKIPTEFTCGIAQKLLRYDQLRWGLGFAQHIGGLPEASAGAEYIFNRMTLRTGYTVYVDSTLFNGIKGLTVGAGFREKRYVFDYTWSGNRKELGDTHYFTLTASFKEIKPKTAEEYFNIALKHFKKGKYKRCIIEAENALRINPNTWKAHTLIARARSMMRKTSGTEFSLIYTGNTNGYVAARKEGNLATGGLARRATVVKRLTAEAPYHLVVDAGNMFTSKTEPLKILTMLEAASIMGYSLLGTGTGEIAGNLERIGNPAKKLKLKYIATNITGINKHQGFIEDYFTVIRNKYKVYVVNLIGDQYKNFLTDKKTDIQQIIPVLRSKLSKKGSKADLRIAIINDDKNSIHYLAKLFPSLDVILCGINGDVYIRPVVVGRTLILSAGKNGQYVGVLNIRFNGKKKILSYQNRLIRLTDEIADEPQVANLMKRMIIKLELQETDRDTILKRGSMNGKFLFVSDRTGKKQIYLKILKNNTAYRLTEDDNNHFGHVYCPANGRVAYIKQWKDSLSDSTYEDLWTMELAGVRHNRITNREHVKSPCWFPGGKYIYFCSDSSGRYEIYRTGAEGGARTNISLSPYSNETYVTFSPSGKDIAFVTDRDRSKQIYLTGKDGRNPLRLTEDRADHAMPLFSPDGKYIAYLCGKFGFNGTKDIVIYNTGTNGIKLLTQNANVRSFVWSRDCNYIIFEAGVNITDLNIVRISDTSIKKLLPTEKFKDYSEQAPVSIIYDNEEWIGYQKSDKNKTVIYRVKTDGSGNQPCSVEKKNNWLH